MVLLVGGGLPTPRPTALPLPGPPQGCSRPSAVEADTDVLPGRPEQRCTPCRSLGGLDVCFMFCWIPCCICDAVGSNKVAGGDASSSRGVACFHGGRPRSRTLRPLLQPLPGRGEGSGRSRESSRSGSHSAVLGHFPGARGSGRPGGLGVGKAWQAWVPGARCQGEWGCSCCVPGSAPLREGVTILLL